METKRFVLLDIDYITEGDKAVVRLFGKIKGDEEGKSIIVLDKNFKPYIYVVPRDIETCADDVSELEVESVEWVRKNDNGQDKDFLKVILNHPQDVPKLRDIIRDLGSVEDIREHDIPFYRRYLVDKGIFPMSEVEVDGKCLTGNDVKFSCEEDVCIFQMEGEPRPLESEFPELKILSFDIEVRNPKGMPQAEVDEIIMISLSSNQGLEKVTFNRKIIT